MEIRYILYCLHRLDNNIYVMPEALIYIIQKLGRYSLVLYVRVRGIFLTIE